MCSVRQIIHNDDITFWVTTTIHSGQVFHREDGPAIELSNGDHIWSWNGVCYPSVEEWAVAAKKTPKEIALLKLKYS